MTLGCLGDLTTAGADGLKLWKGLEKTMEKNILNIIKTNMFLLVITSFITIFNNILIASLKILSFSAIFLVGFVFVFCQRKT